MNSSVDGQQGVGGKLFSRDIIIVYALYVSQGRCVIGPLCHRVSMS